MTMLVTDITPRHCSRCRKELTDPSSRECGVGPICRGKNNHLYAKTIAANIPAASAIVLGTHTDNFPSEVHERWETFKARFLRRMRQVELQSDLLFNGADFRECVRDVDYMLSFHMPTNLQKRLVEIVRHLGYPGLSSVLSGEASLSVAKLWLDAGRVHMQGKSCKSGFRAMRRIPGIQTPRYRGHQVPYSAPASQVEPFLEAVQSYWPMYEGDLDDLRKQAEEYIKNSPSVMSTSDISEVSEEPKAEIRLRSEDFTVKFPWIKGAPMYETIGTIKSVPSVDRNYNPTTKTWSLKLSHLDTTKLALKKVFSDEQIVISETNEATPDYLYRRPSRRTKRNFARTGRRTWGMP